MVGAFSRGLSSASFESMTVGMIMDYIITYNNVQYESREERGDSGEKIREATQEDMDFF